MVRSTETLRDVRRRQGNLFDKMARDISEGVRSYVQVFALATYSYVLKENYGTGDGGSPVWTGTYASAHNLSIGSPVYKELQRPEPPVQGSVTVPAFSARLAEAKVALEMWQVGQPIYLTNAAKDQTGRYYAGAIERGLSTKTPEGVYRLAFSYAEKVTPRYAGAKPEGFSISVSGGV